MNKKELITPFAIAALSLIFVAVCFMVFVSGGKSKKWIAHKMKIGGILLSLSAISTGTGCITCYDMPEPLEITINGSNGYDIEIDLDTGNVISGTLYMKNMKDFSFNITDFDELEKQSGQLISSDGEFGQQTELFTLELDKTLAAGNYSLKIFDCKADLQENTYPFKQFYLKIKNE